MIAARPARRPPRDARDRGLQDHELVAAEAGDDVGLAHNGCAAVGDCAQQLVAARWPSVSLTCLNWSRSMNSTANGPRAAQAAPARCVHLVAEEAAVGQPGQRVVARELADLASAVLRSVMSSNRRRPSRRSAIGWKVKCSVRPVASRTRSSCPRRQPLLEFDGEPSRLRAQDRAGITQSRTIPDSRALVLVASSTPSSSPAAGSNHQRRGARRTCTARAACC